jgi:hypothetical protein
VKRGVIYLLIAVPVATLIMGGITLYLALSDPPQAVKIDAKPLSKTSWREGSDDR